MPDAVMSGGARVVSSATLAHIGDGIRQVALPLLVVSMTRHPIAVSGLTAVSFLPWVLLGLPIGAYVDQGRPLAVAVGANLGRAVLLGLLAVTLLVGFRSIALVYDDPDGAPHLFTGDSLFPGGVGNTQGDAERFTSLINDVETKLFNELPDETWVYPGHGSDTTLGAERPHLAEWRERGW